MSTISLRFTAPKVMFKTRYASYLLIARYDKLTPPPQDIPYECTLVSLGFSIVQKADYRVQISEQGNICIDILKQNWSPALSLFKVMLSLSSLLTDPNPSA